MKRFLLGTLMAAATVVAPTQATYDTTLHNKKFYSKQELMNGIRDLFVDQNIDISEIRIILQHWKMSSPYVFSGPSTMLIELADNSEPCKGILGGRAHQIYRMIQQIAPRIFVTTKDIFEILSFEGVYSIKKTEELNTHLKALRETYEFAPHLMHRSTVDKISSICGEPITIASVMEYKSQDRLQQLIEMIDSFEVKNALTREQITILGEFLAIEMMALRTNATANRQIELLKKLAQVSNITLQEEVQL